MKLEGILSGDWLRRYLRTRSADLSVPLSQDELARSAVIFSPHYDDETLGCGGLIVKKKRAGADVKIVFMTDGSASHDPSTFEEELATMRQAEAFAAGRILGIGAHDILPLAFPDQRLSQHHAEAVERVTKFLQEHRPKQLWLPHSDEPLIWSRDHQATTSIIKEAALKVGASYEIFEYPVWLWFSYPWIDLPTTRRRETLWLLRISLSSWCGTRLAQSCSLVLDISDVIGVKRAALEAYRSQMGEPSSGPSLSKVADGQFLDCFFQPCEVFARGSLKNA